MLPALPEYLEQLAQKNPQGIVIWQMPGDKVEDAWIVWCNRQASVESGTDMRAFYGKPMGEAFPNLFGDGPESTFPPALQTAIEKQEPARLPNYRSVDADGGVSYYTIDLIPVGPDACAAVYANTTIQRRIEDRLSRVSREDEKTGLLNQSALKQAFAESVARGFPLRRLTGLIALDLNGFKRVNDTHGHAVGDECLKIAADRLRRAVRVRDHVGRIGGDEFAVVLEDVAKESDVMAVAKKVHAALSAPYRVPSLGLDLQLGAAIGATSALLAADSFQETLKQADDAMYRSKRQRSGPVLYCED